MLLPAAAAALANKPLACLCSIGGRWEVSSLLLLLLPLLLLMLVVCNTHLLEL
jgi:hypothetical protein